MRSLGGRDESLPYKGDQLEFILSKGNRLKAFPKGEGFKTHSPHPFQTPIDCLLPSLTVLIRTRLNARYFAAFHLIGLDGRQPTFNLCGKNQSKYHTF